MPLAKQPWKVGLQGPNYTLNVMNLLSVLGKPTFCLRVGSCNIPVW
jgi:hypothetical protein